MNSKERKSFKVKPIGIIHSPFTKADGVPIQSAFAKGLEGWIDIFPEFAEGLSDLEGFERIWLLSWFHKASKVKLKVRPYLDSIERGLFATRAPSRPNPIGISVVRLLRIDGCKIYIAELDIIDGTPLLDIKPYAPKFDHFEAKHIGWLEKARSETNLADNRFFEKQ